MTPTNSNCAIMISGITFRYSGESHAIFENVTVCLTHGSRTALWGESGSGKSTLLALIGGHLVPEAGTLQNYCAASGMVLQNNGLYPWLTALQNVCLALRPVMSMTERREKALNVFRRLGVDDLADRRCSELSGGEERRIQIARLLCSEADLWLLDEPFAGLDPQNRELCRNIILQAQQETSATVVIATHSIEDLFVLGENVLLIGNKAMNGLADGGALPKDSSEKREFIEDLMK